MDKKTIKLYIRNKNKEIELICNEFKKTSMYVKFSMKLESIGFDNEITINIVDFTIPFQKINIICEEYKQDGFKYLQTVTIDVDYDNNFMEILLDMKFHF